jgi:hypothetical protein
MTALRCEDEERGGSSCVLSVLENLEFSPEGVGGAKDVHVEGEVSTNVTHFGVEDHFNDEKGEFAIAGSKIVERNFKWRNRIEYKSVFIFTKKK